MPEARWIASGILAHCTLQAQGLRSCGLHGDVVYMEMRSAGTMKNSGDAHRSGCAQAHPARLALSRANVKGFDEE